MAMAGQYKNPGRPVRSVRSTMDPNSFASDPNGIMMLNAESGVNGSNSNNGLMMMMPQPTEEGRASEFEATTRGGNAWPYYAASLNVFLKLLFYGCIIGQVILWPSVMTITFAGGLALEGLLIFLFSGGISAATGSLTEYAVLLLHGQKVSTAKYIAMCFLAAYTLAFFLLFVSHETRVLPSQTVWIHPTLFGKYSFTDTRNNAFQGVDVTSDVSKAMRGWTYTWPKSLQAQAIAVNTTIQQGQGVSGGPLHCSTPGAFECYSAKLAEVDPPGDAIYPAHKRYVPFPSQFYMADVIVTPPAGVQCSALEVYRVTLDPTGNVEHGLDYPASATAGASAMINGSIAPPYRKCNLFGFGNAWCLQFLHAFSDVEYSTQMAGKCALGDNQQLTIRLPPRAPDVYPTTGRMGQDLILVTEGAHVEIRWTWHDLGAQASLLNAWDQTRSSSDDKTQPWRDSTDPAAVFFKYAIACIPFQLLWYFLAIRFRGMVENYQILMMCIFVLLPATLFFLTVGAWLPMAGCIICVLAINHTPAVNAKVGSWSPNMRHALLFLTAVCNSIQFIWILVLVGQANWSAFLYDDTLQQLADMSSQFIITGEPTWIGLVLPTALLINFAFVVGAAICVAMELLASYSMRRGGLQPSA